MTRRQRARRLAAAAVLLGLSGGPAGSAAAEEAAPPSAAETGTAPDPLFDEDFDAGLDAGVRDPLEPANRGVFAANQALDDAVFGPIARFYGWVVPAPGRRAVRRVFENLNEPVVFVNDLLQLEFRRAGTSFVRFALDTTFGVGGLLDASGAAGLEPHYSDFGQTLGRYGVGPGVYLVLPLLGPSTTRDAVGSVVDLALRIDTWVLPMGGRLLIGGTSGIAQRDAHRESLEALEASSVDFYASLRSAYWMTREALVREARERARATTDPDRPDRPELAGAP